MVFFPKVTQGKHFKPLTAHQSEMHVSSFPDEMPLGAKQSLHPSPAPSSTHMLSPWAKGHPEKRVGTSPDLIPPVILKMPTVYLPGTAPHLETCEFLGIISA